MSQGAIYSHGATAICVACVLKARLRKLLGMACEIGLHHDPSLRTLLLNVAQLTADVFMLAQSFFKEHALIVGQLIIITAMFTHSFLCGCATTTTTTTTNTIGMAQGSGVARWPSPGEPRGAQGSSGEPSKAQDGPGELRGAQGSLREPRRAQESPGEPRRPQETPGEFRRPLENSGEPMGAH